VCTETYLWPAASAVLDSVVGLELHLLADSEARIAAIVVEMGLASDYGFGIIVVVLLVLFVAAA
jgi:hypothetical protein